MSEDKSLTWSDIEKLKIEIDNTYVVVYRKDSKEDFQATGYTGPVTKKILETLYSEQGFTGAVVFTRKSFDDYMNGNPKNRTDKIPEDFVKTVVAKFFTK